MRIKRLKALSWVNTLPTIESQHSPNPAASKPLKPTELHRSSVGFRSARNRRVRVSPPETPDGYATALGSQTPISGGRSGIAAGRRHAQAVHPQGRKVCH